MRIRPVLSNLTDTRPRSRMRERDREVHEQPPQEIVRDDADRDRLQEQLGKAAIRCSWRVYAFAIMSNHLHIVLKTPQPNLARGMQVLDKCKARSVAGIVASGKCAEPDVALQ